ncbi:MAG: DNA-3-methyladenine glycosylase 2 family protein, partial [Chloroflexota bacterium]|nr:DNA-3-methyladenine glycosylase 2 family protein [Chloroflexota bacterium]
MIDNPLSLTPETLLEGLHILHARDPDLATILDRFGPPPIWARQPGFPTLIHIILEQQVSLASALATFTRLLALVTPLTPSGFLQLDDATLRAIGFSRQKAGYARHLAASIVEGELDLDGLATLDDNAARTQLTKLKGIGAWTADIYLLVALQRPDVWPVGDLALVIGVQEIK